MTLLRKIILNKLGRVLQNKYGLPVEIYEKILSYIPNYWILICRLSECNNNTLIGESYCPIHICNVPLCSEYAKKFMYCRIHNCKYRRCMRRRLPHQLFCILHKCVKMYCNQPVYDVVYCADHLLETYYCRAPGCGNHPIGFAHNYCMSHICYASGCDSQRIGGEVYCQKCICSEYDCSFARHVAKSGLMSSYCMAHKCSNPYCVRKSLGGKLFCLICQ